MILFFLRFSQKSTMNQPAQISLSLATQVSPSRQRGQGRQTGHHSGRGQKFHRSLRSGTNLLARPFFQLTPTMFRVTKPSVIPDSFCASSNCHANATGNEPEMTAAKFGVLLDNYRDPRHANFHASFFCNLRNQRRAWIYRTK